MTMSQRVIKNKIIVFFEKKFSKGLTVTLIRSIFVSSNTDNYIFLPTIFPPL